jgi:preprotein translocase subunit SecG
MYQAITILHVLVALSIVGLVLIQRGRGADAGAGFGGSSNTLFGARGAATFLSKTTAVMAALFFGTSLILAYLSEKKDNKQLDIMERPAVQQRQSDLPQDVTEPAKPDATPDLPNRTDLPPAETGQK